MDCSESGDDGRRSESVRDEGEVREVALDRRVQDLGRASVAQRRSVLVQEIHELLDHHPGMRKASHF